MGKTNINIGDIVDIPMTKSVGASLRNSAVINSAMEKDYDCLYVIDAFDLGIDRIYVLADEPDDDDGDFFLECDLTLVDLDLFRVELKDCDNKVIINAPAIIYIIKYGYKGKMYKGVAKCMPEDKFDILKGIRIARLKAQIKEKESMLKDLFK